MLHNHNEQAPETADEFQEKATAISRDLESFRPSGPYSVAALAVELRTQIRGALSKGARYADIAGIFRSHGVDATSDAIRRALQRNITTKAARARKITISAPVQTPPAPRPAHSRDEKPALFVRPSGVPNIARRPK